MRRHWQKKPLLIRAAVPEARGLVDRAALFELAARDEVESRVVVRDAERWSLRQGPFARRALPALKQPAWTLLVQGADLHLESAHRLLQRFRFVPDARLDDLMLSFATDGGGVGPHVDSYDVFLLQVGGRRRWRIGRAKTPLLRADVPLKMLSNFAPTEEWLLEPGDMLYLPPGWAHDGVAEGEAITASIGFRSAGLDELGCRSDAAAARRDRAARSGTALCRSAPARDHRAGAHPDALGRYADESVPSARRPGGARWALGETLSEPKPGVWFDAGTAFAPSAGLRLDRRTRMLYDDSHVFINGDSYRAGGRDAKLVRRLADRRRLLPRDVGALSGEARELITHWIAAGWLHSDAGA